MTDVDMASASGNADGVTEDVVAYLANNNNTAEVDIEDVMRRFTSPTSDQLRRVLAACATSNNTQRVSAVLSRLAPRIEVPFVGSTDDAAERLVVFLTAPASDKGATNVNMKAVMDVLTKSPSLEALTRVLEACKASTSIQRVSTVVTHLQPHLLALQRSRTFKDGWKPLVKLWCDVAFFAHGGSSNVENVCNLRDKFNDGQLTSDTRSDDYARARRCREGGFLQDVRHRLAAALRAKTAEGCVDMCLVIRLLRHVRWCIKSIMDGDKRRGQLHETLHLVDLFVRCLDTALDATFAKCDCVAGDGVDMATYRILVQLELAYYIVLHLRTMQGYIDQGNRDVPRGGDSDASDSESETWCSFGEAMCQPHCARVSFKTPGTGTRAQIRERNVHQVFLEKLLSSGLLHRLLALTIAPLEDPPLAELTKEARTKVMSSKGWGYATLVHIIISIATHAHEHGGNLCELAELRTATLRMLVAFEPLLSRECRLREELASENLVVTYAHALEMVLASGAAAQDDDSALPRDVECAASDCCDTAATGGPMQLLPCGHGLHTTCAKRLCDTPTVLFTEPRPSSMVCRHCGASLLGPTRRVVQAWTRAWGRDLQLANPSVMRVEEARTAVHTGAGIGAGAGAPAATPAPPPPPASSLVVRPRPTAMGASR